MSKTPQSDPEWQRRDRILRGTPAEAVPKGEDAPIVDQPTEDGGPVREPADKPFERDPDLVEADHTLPPADTSKR